MKYDVHITEVASGETRIFRHGDDPDWDRIDGDYVWPELRRLLAQMPLGRFGLSLIDSGAFRDARLGAFGRRGRGPRMGTPEAAKIIKRWNNGDDPEDGGAQ